MGSLKRAYNALEGSTTPVVESEKWLELMAASRERTNKMNSYTEKDPFAFAFYSSITDAITTDPTMMIVPVDDAQFVRGHGIFESAALANGRVYRIEAHIDRLFDGAKKACLPLPFPGDEEANRKRIRQIIIDTCVAGGHKDGMIRFFLSKGHGNFGMTQGCEQVFYCVIHPWKHLPLTGHKEVTTRDVPTKPPMLAEMKSTNYMLNMLMYLDAKDRGGNQGIWVLPNGNVAETCGSGLCFITKDRKLITPDFPGILASTTVRRLLELGEKLREKGLVTEVLRQDISEADAKKADEIIKLGGGVHISPVTEWDGQKVGTGEVGPVAKELQKMVTEESEHPSSYKDSIELKYFEPLSAETNGVLDKSAWLEKMKASRQRIQQEVKNTEPPALSLYSSLTDAITTDFDMMFVPVDDRAFVRGHAIFESICITNGRIYRLQAHLDRFFSSSKKARIPLPFPGDEGENRKRITQIVTDTCTAVGFVEGVQIRLVLSGGSGTMGISLDGVETTFYCWVHTMKGTAVDTGGHAEVTTTVPMKPALLSEMKSNNYMLNTLMCKDAKKRGGMYGIWVHENGNVAETCGAGLVFVTKDSVLRTPKFDGILPSCTVRRVLEVAQGMKKKGLLKDVRQEDIPVAEAKEAAEVIMCAVGIKINAVIEWDGKKVGTGEVGPVAKELKKIIHEEAKYSTTYEDVIQLKYPPSAKAAKVHIA